ncbi:MAG: glycosyltransferase [Acidobacteria bacterium]|nr:glycosyltransferase [Acidobacteriota bacterium]
MIFVYYFFAAVLILLSYRSLVGGFRYLAFFRKELARPRSEYTPFVSVIAPYRGIDDGMPENLAALFGQDFPEYEIIFVVDDESDPAVALVRTESNAGSPDGHPGRGVNVRSRLVIAPKAQDCSQKVENLREAVLHADHRSEIYVFVDSDARPSSNWLRDLIAPLQDDEVGATTGYRWFISKKPNFASELNSVWNASIASALGPNTSSNFCWGGSMAIRCDTFERLDMRTKWQGTLSDDFAVTRAMDEANMPIVFVPQAMAATLESCDLRQMLEFTTRQMKITRVYAPSLWLMSFIGSGLFNVVMIASLLIAIFSRSNGWQVAAAITTLVLVSAFSIGKAYLRLKAVRLTLTQWDKELRKQTFSQLTLFLLAPLIFFYNCFAAWLSRRMTWRGTTYVLKSNHETVIIAD